LPFKIIVNFAKNKQIAMTIAQRFKALFTGDVTIKNPLINKLDRIVSRWVGFGIPVTNISQSPEGYVKQGYMANNYVAQAVNYITRKASSVPLKLYKIQGEEKVEITSHPILDLINKPNRWQGWNEFCAQALGYKEITGNSYIYKMRYEAGPNKGKPFELNIMPAHMTEVVTGDDWQDPIKGYRITYAPDVLFLKDEVLHFRYPAYDYDLGDFYGQSPLLPLLKVVNKSNSNHLAAKAAFDNIGAAGIITDEATDEFSAITGEQAKTLEDRYNEKFGSADKKGRVLVTVGKLRWQQIGLSPVDLNMIRDQQETRRDICAAYGLSSNLFNDVEGTTFTNMKEARKAAWTDAIMPALDDFLNEFNRDIVALWGEDLILEADYSGVEELQADKAEMSAWLDRAWYIKGSEKRVIMGMDADPALDYYFIPPQLVPYQELPPLTIPDDDQA